ncbi:MAG: hypothetical protein AMDU5_GPLC00017G0028 [Thermoplasmatales archaeon Gpl]|nr:MAG: hypothetical protein AMDU5_GPLC00017G0028 [Thermoplasmatales archaeon Gpl]
MLSALAGQQGWELRSMHCLKSGSRVPCISPSIIYVGILSLVVNLAVLAVAMLVVVALKKVKEEGIIENAEFQDISEMD